MKYLDWRSVIETVVQACQDAQIVFVQYQQSLMYSHFKMYSLTNKHIRSLRHIKIYGDLPNMRGE
ncbi:hypothetical protein D3C77_307920 [compost metagenome]